MVLFSEMYASELIGDPVVDWVQEPVGKVVDILVEPTGPFPKVSGLLIKSHKHKKDCVLPIGEIDSIGRQFVVGKTIGDRMAFCRPFENGVFLQRDIMDKQIVDVDGARVIRVNDIKLAKVGLDIHLVAVDVGMWGILRRLRLDNLTRTLSKFIGLTIPDKLIGWDHIESLKTDIAKGQLAIPHKRTSELHPADIAQIISQVHNDEKAALFSSLNEKTAAESLHELEPKIGAMLLQTIDTKKALGILSKMPVDESADLIGDLPEPKAQEILLLIGQKKSEEIKKLLKHHDESAGGLMTTEFVALTQNLTVDQAIASMRENAPSAETIYYLYVVDDEGRLKGIVSLRSLITSPPEKLLSEIMHTKVITVTPDINQKQVADLISKYNLLAVPVLDNDQKLLGIITVDDVMDFILPPASRRKRQMIG
jgi:CBS domain-containing protein/uncharacterized protein YrrD